MPRPGSGWSCCGVQYYVCGKSNGCFGVSSRGHRRHLHQVVVVAHGEGSGGSPHVLAKETRNTPKRCQSTPPPQVLSGACIFTIDDSTEVAAVTSSFAQNCTDLTKTVVIALGAATATATTTSPVRVHVQMCCTCVCACVCYSPVAPSHHSPPFPPTCGHLCGPHEMYSTV